MTDCNISINYLKEKARMTDSCGILCKDCPLNTLDHLSCFYLEAYSPKKAIEIVQKWSDEHHQKTYKDDFFEKYPNARKYDDETPVVCRNRIYGLEECRMDKLCNVCWNEVMPKTE